MDVTCEVNEWSAHKVELAENVQNILLQVKTHVTERHGSQKVFVTH